MTEENRRPEDSWQVDPQRLKEATDALFHRDPKLTPRLDKWAEDMPGIREEQIASPRLVRVNEINVTWLEIPRYENIMWGGGVDYIGGKYNSCDYVFYTFLSAFYP